VVEKKTSPKVFFACFEKVRKDPTAEDRAEVVKRFPDPPRASRRKNGAEALTDGFAVAVAAADAAAR
jgi:hypothetical protein